MSWPSSAPAPGRVPWYPWTLTGLAAGSSIALNFAHPYIPLDPPPRLLVALVYGVPPVCAPFAWHLFLLRLAHRHQHADQDGAQDIPDPADTSSTRAGLAPAADDPPPVQTAVGPDGEPSRAAVRVLLTGETNDAPVSWQDVASRTGLSRSRAYALLREERARLAASNGHHPPPPHAPPRREGEVP